MQPSSRTVFHHMQSQVTRPMHLSTKQSRTWEMCMNLDVKYTSIVRMEESLRHAPLKLYLLASTSSQKHTGSIGLISEKYPLSAT
jgi:hypothetical protein